MPMGYTTTFTYRLASYSTNNLPRASRSALNLFNSVDMATSAASATVFYRVPGASAVQQTGALRIPAAVREAVRLAANGYTAKITRTSTSTYSGVTSSVRKSLLLMPGTARNSVLAIAMFYVYAS